MKDRISLLDCTLRDGSYIVDSKFGAPAIKGIIRKLQEAEADIIECGWLKNDAYQYGSTFYHVPDDLEQYMSKNKKCTYVLMIDWDRYDLSFLPLYNGKNIDAIRVVFPHGRHKEAIEVGQRIKEKGYQVYFQAANTLGYNDKELRDLADAMNGFEPVSLSVVDTFGAMYPEDLKRIVSILDQNLKETIKLGFHSHNNQQLSFALTMEFLKMLEHSERGIILDASLCGMGRGAGNATTELVVSYLNRTYGCHYNMDAVMDAIDTYMGYFQENYHWGYSTPYFIAGLYCCHVNNIAYLLNNHRTKAKDMRNIIESLPPEDRKKYDYDLLERKYLQNQNYYVDDTNFIKALSDILRGKEVLLIAPGRQALSEQVRINRYIAEHKPVVIGVNAILPDYKYDYMFFVNPARYDYAQTVFPKAFNGCRRILLSNIKCTPAENEYVISFNNTVKRGWEHFDNAVICCLRLLRRLCVGEVSIAGFDGFKTKYNESYADPYLPSLNPDNKWDELNKEIKEMFDDFRSEDQEMHLQFLTDSQYMS